MHASKAITVNRPPEEVYAFWRRFENLPRFMYHLQSVTDLGNGRTHWVARAPRDKTVEWDAELVEDRPGSLIAWRSSGEKDDVKNRGSVRFDKAPGDRGTEIRVELDYEPPAGKAGAVFAKVFDKDAEEELADDLRRFKQVMEVGEVVRSSAVPEGMGPAVPEQGPAQPSEEAVEAHR
jgi:uncharacterized membrane protein